MSSCRSIPSQVDLAFAANVNGEFEDLGIWDYVTPSIFGTWGSVLVGPSQVPKSWLALRLFTTDPNPRPNLVPKRYQIWYQIGTKSGPKLVPNLTPKWSQIWYQSGTKYGTKMLPNMVPNCNQIWYQTGAKSDTKMISNLVPKWYQIWRRLDKLLPRMANTSLQDGPHYDFFWLTLLPPKRVHARTGLKTFVLRYTVDPKTDHLSARQTP